MQCLHELLLALDTANFFFFFFRRLAASSQWHVPSRGDYRRLLLCSSVFSSLLRLGRFGGWVGGLSLQTLNFAPNFCLSDAVEDGGAETQSSSGVNCPPANEANERLALSLPLLSNMNRKCQEDNSLATPPLEFQYMLSHVT